jgi:hypothetical protein
MRRRPRSLPCFLLLAALAGLACAGSAPPSTAPRPPDPAALADRAVLYALPLVIMDLTREQYFADPIAVDATPGSFLHVPILANPTFRAVVRPNVDTLYSTAWLDLSREPVLMTLPPSDGRYYLIQCMDAWTNAFFAPGIRTLGNREGKFAIVGPSWSGEAPAGFEVVRAPTPMVWVLNRVYVRDAADLGAGRAFQRRIDLRPASRAGDAALAGGVYPKPRDPSAPPRKIMRDLLHEIGAEAFFERFSRLAAANPASPADPKFAADVLAPLGLAPGARWASLTDAQRQALTGGLDRALRALDEPGIRNKQRTVGPTGWSSLSQSIAQGTYGTDYRVRAGVAAIGLGANLREDAIYLNAGVDGAGQPLDGDKRYRLRFAADQTPPVRAFWSVTLYDEKGYLVPSPVERYAIKSGDDTVREPDGSLVIYLQPDDPGPDHRANWLPTPAHMRFELSLRAYWPGAALLDGTWTPPPVAPVGGAASGQAAAEPPADPERAAIAAYRAKDHAAFLTHMRVVHARDPDAPRAIYNLASAEALGGSPDAAVARLRQLAELGLAFAIARDDDFAGLRGRADFQAVVRAMAANGAPRGRAAPVFTLRERDLITEGVAYDARTRTVFVSSVRHRKIVAIDAANRQRDFITEGQDGIAGAFGMAIDPARRVLWAASTALPHMLGYRAEDKHASGLFAFELATGALVRAYPLPRDGRPHALGDVIVASSGDAYATDSLTPTVYRVDAARGALEVVVEGGFLSLQGLALSADQRTLYVADYARGLYAVDLASRAVTHLAVAPGIAVAGIDGLYLHRGRLIATQNGIEPRRVVALELDAAGARVVRQRVLLSGDPRIADLSLGAIVGDALYLNAAAGWDHYGDDGAPRREPAPPHVILKLALPG